jgi:hypothetical protein
VDASYTVSIQEIVACGDDPLRRGAAQLRKLNEAKPRAFAESGLDLVIRQPACQEHKYLCFLLSTNPETAGLLTDPKLPFAQALHVSKALRKANPDFPSLLGATIRDQAHLLEGPVLERTLNLLDAISIGSPLAGRVANLLEHPDVRVSSKAAIFVGRRLRNLAWAERNMANPDGRVRANIVESLWGADSPEARKLLQAARADSDNRVAGNALYGLYLLDEIKIVPALIELAHHASPASRLTAAWVMGETADVRFLGELALLVRDPDGPVRSGAFKAIRRIKDSIRKCEEAGRLTVSTLPSVPLDGTSFYLPVIVLNAQSRPVRNLAHARVTTYVGRTLVTSYSLKERSAPDGIRNVTCVFAGIDDSAVLRPIVRRLHAFINASKGRDVWRLYTVKPPKSDEVRFVWQNEIEGAASAAALEAEADDVRMGLTLLEYEKAIPAIVEVVETLGRMPGEGRLVVFAAAGRMSEEDWQPIVRVAKQSKTAVDLIVVGGDPAATVLRAAAADTGGLCLTASDANLMAVVDVLCGALGHRYDLTLTLPQGVPSPSSGAALRGEVRITSEAGWGQAGFELISQDCFAAAAQ